MADKGEGAGKTGRDRARADEIQSAGRKANAAQPLNAARDKGGPERYPSADRTDAVEPRSFDPPAEAPAPRQSAGDTSPPSGRNEGYLGPGGDPAEGKR
jgi:hypothetical protein